MLCMPRYAKIQSNFQTFPIPLGNYLADWRIILMRFNPNLYQIDQLMSLFRSALMKYYELYIPKEDAYHVVAKLAPHGFVEFLDAAANNFHKPYYNSIRRCEDVVSKISQILRMVRGFNIELPEVPLVERVFEKHAEIIAARKVTELALLDEMEDEIERNFAALTDAQKSLDASQKQIIDLEDYKYLLFKAREIFNSKREEGEEAVDFSKTTLEQLRLVNVSGIIESKDLLKFSKMIFRATKGNSILYTFNIPNDSPQILPRTAFIVILEAGSNILTKVSRICDTFYAKKYALPTNKDQIFQKIKEIEDTITDTKQLATMTEKKLREDLTHSISDSDYGYSKFEAYRILLQREALIFHTMNFLEERYNSLIAKIWITEEKRGLLFKLLPSVVTIREPDTDEKPPTHFQMNSFTAPFQEIINTYGIPRYQEVNPALFAIPIFPFLFGVMFGDIGHGGLLLALSLWLIWSKDAKQLLPEVYSLRYLVLLMGSFAFYSGWIYNEFFSIPLNVFGTCYGHAEPEEEAERMEHCVYPFGFDPRWIRASNELTFFNSYKMKFAVIIGVAQMTLAIFLKALNTLHFKNYVDFFFEWLPQQIFFFCTFGYMCILIIFKWSIAWGEERPTSEAPSLIAQMIALPLKMGSTEGKPLWDLESQESLQYNFLMISLICVPWMLIIKPVILWCRMPHHPAQHIPQAHQLQDSLHDHLDDEADRPKKEKEVAKPQGGHDEDISEIAVHQIIETIEFVLGSISNTASYLRLWALSLAHGQLSRVFLEKTIGGGIESANTIVIAIGMYFFLNISLGVIMAMDSMECFLHALRLQWVEFDSKFFKADGRKFQPLCLDAPLQASAIKLRLEGSE